jgi:Rieske 2Fe-2S family protein
MLNGAEVMSTLMPSILELLKADRPGYTLPRDLYVSDEAFAFDTQVMLKSVWLYACTVAHVRKHGDYFLFEIGNNSIIIIRGKDDRIRAFYNTCRHRGAKLCTKQQGSLTRLMCTYHFWTYGLEGQLVAARGMPEEFEKSANGLTQIALENIAGLIFICFSEKPPPIDRAKVDIGAQVAPYRLERLKVAVEEELIDTTNWKLVIENNRECYHCQSNHPELLRSLSGDGFGRGLPEDDDGTTSAVVDAELEAQREHWRRLGIYHDLIEFPDNGWHRVVRLGLSGGAVSQTLDGKPASKKLIWPFDHMEPTSLSVWTQPNSWHHFCCDHVVTFSVTPMAADKTRLRTSWLVHEDAVEGVDYDPDNLAAVWRATNHQDRRICELNHAGIVSDGYRPGMYALEERLVHAFKTFYVERSMAALAAIGCGKASST